MNLIDLNNFAVSLFNFYLKLFVTLKKILQKNANRVKEVLPTDGRMPKLVVEIKGEWNQLLNPKTYKQNV